MLVSRERPPSRLSATILPIVEIEIEIEDTYLSVLSPASLLPLREYRRTTAESIPYLCLPESSENSNGTQPPAPDSPARRGVRHGV